MFFTFLHSVNDIDSRLFSHLPSMRWFFSLSTNFSGIGALLSPRFLSSVSPNSVLSLRVPHVWTPHELSRATWVMAPFSLKIVCGFRSSLLPSDPFVGWQLGPGINPSSALPFHYESERGFKLTSPFELFASHLPTISPFFPPYFLPQPRPLYWPFSLANLKGFASLPATTPAAAAPVFFSPPPPIFVPLIFFNIKARAFFVPVPIVCRLPVPLSKAVNQVSSPMRHYWTGLPFSILCKMLSSLLVLLEKPDAALFSYLSQLSNPFNPADYCYMFSQTFNTYKVTRSIFTRSLFRRIFQSLRPVAPPTNIQTPMSVNPSFASSPHSHWSDLRSKPWLFPPPSYYPQSFSDDVSAMNPNHTGPCRSRRFPPVNE